MVLGPRPGLSDTRVGTVVTSKPAVKVLVADDSEGDRSAARDALTAAGYAVVEAVDGQQALEVFARERPDLVMLDVVMPRLTGLEACRILKAKTQSTYMPVIMVSTRNSVNARVEGLRSGADDYVGKPYDAEELRARVEALLRVKRAVTEAAGGKPMKAGDEVSARGDAAFHRRLEAEFDRAERYNDPLACLRIELDQYETVAGAHGSAAADELVTGLRDIIDSSVRKIDLSHRRDPRGYLLALPNTHFPGALAVAERICRDSRRLKRPQSIGGPLTVSVGVAFFPNKDTRSLADLLELVDLALERARGEGGAKICLYQHQGYLYAPEE